MRGELSVFLLLLSAIARAQTKLEPQPEPATVAMIDLFRTHQIVMFGETHGNKQEYEWLCNLVKTPEFADRVDDIVVEFGNALDQKTVDRYVAGEDVPFDEVQKAWRNMVADVEPVSPVYGWLYEAVREAVFGTNAADSHGAMDQRFDVSMSGCRGTVSSAPTRSARLDA